MGCCTDKMASFISTTGFGDLPAHVVHQAKLLTLDVIGCAMSGFSHDRGRISRQIMESFGGNPQATVIGSGKKIACIGAAYANANMASSLDNEETFMNAHHFSSNSVFSALAVAEKENASGKDLITAVAVGYDVGARVILSTGFLGKIVDGKVVRYSVVGAPCAHSMGSVASVSNLLKLSQQQAVHALGLQGHLSPMPSTHLWTAIPDYLPLVKYGDNGWMAVGGIMSALLAREGFTSYPSGVLDGKDGFWKMYGAETCDFEVMTEELGNKWWIMEASFKPWPSCRYTHHPLTAIRRIVDKYNIEPEEVDSVVIKGSLIAWLPHFYNQDPKGPVDQQFSASHAVAMLMFRIPPGPDWQRADIMENPRIKEFRHRVTVELDPAMLQQVSRQISQQPRVIKEVPVTVEIIARGQTFVETVNYATGDPWEAEFRMDDEELKTKFRVNACSLLPLSAKWRQRVEEIVAACLNLEQLANVNQLTQLYSSLI